MDSGTMLTLSDIYSDDIQGEAIIVLRKPSSASKNRGDERLFFNDKWLVDDELDPLNADTAGYGIQNNMIIGNKIKIVGPKAPDYFVKHWETILKQDVTIRYGSLNEALPHLVLFPCDALRHDLHAVDPNVHWQMFSKKLIQDVDCPQASVLDKDNMKYPCFVKLGRSNFGKGVWQVTNENQYLTLMDFLTKNIPTADIIVTEAIQNVLTTFTAIFYISKKGELRWIGVTESIFDDFGIFFGGTVNIHEQDNFKKLLLPAVKPVGEALYQEGFFGICNVDLVLDNKGDVFVVDINPRIGSTTKLLLFMLHLQSQGYGLGFYYSINFKMSATDVIKFAEGIKEGRVIILRIIPKDNGETMECSVMVFCQNRNAYQAVMQIIYSKATGPHDLMSLKRIGGKQST